MIFQRTRHWAANCETVRRWRKRRCERFLKLCRDGADDAILDVDEGAGAALERFDTTNEIVAVDLNPLESEWLQASNVIVRVADGTRLPFQDGAFRVVLSSSVIEHVPKDLQARFVSEIRRVGRRYFVQTPNRYFPREPHYQVPFIRFLPERLRRFLNKRFTLGWQQKGSWEDITLPSARDLRRLFPDGEVHRARILGLTKSLMVVRR